MSAEEDVPDDDHLGWLTIHGGDFLAFLHRAHAGESPDHLYAEMYANAEHVYPGEEQT